jgi:uncharacterized protein (DUF608 family)
MKNPIRLLVIVLAIHLVSCGENSDPGVNTRSFNGSYQNEYLNRIAFPMGGIGTGMICLEGTGGISHVSVRNKPDIFNEPFMFAAISIKGLENGAKVLEGPVPGWKLFGLATSGNGNARGVIGYPHFEKASFQCRFPFATVELQDEDIPLDVSLTGWSPFIPGDADNSSLPVASLEYTFKNTSNQDIQAVFSYHAENFMRMETISEWGRRYNTEGTISGIRNGFLLEQSCQPDKPHYKGDFAIFTDHKNTVTDLAWFRGGWFDAGTMIWKDLSEFTFEEDTTKAGSQGASIYVPLNLEPGEEETVRLQMAWYVPHSELRTGPAPTAEELRQAEKKVCDPSTGCCPPGTGDLYYEPWYAGRFKDINDLVKKWTSGYEELRAASRLFSDAFYTSSLPDEVLEAVAANLTILKSPTVLRQKDGNLWAWEGCHDNNGCCAGSCTHVWNYAQAIPNLFPDLERTLRETEFTVSQNIEGHQTFRSLLPIREVEHGFHAASDGQLGGIMKMHREWRISGDTEWMKELLPAVKNSLDYCINAWDPERKGVLEEPHHNTYDIEFWGPDGMCTSFYLGALSAFVHMGEAADLDVSEYREIFQKGKTYLENELFNGEYFIQEVKWQGLKSPDPTSLEIRSIGGGYSTEASELLKKEGPKYQYGNGCISDGVLGNWIGEMSFVDNLLDPEKVRSHLLSVHKYNFKTDLSDHVNPQRPGYANGHEGGLLLCSWPQGGEPSLPFVYSNEVWTGIEYQVASHLMIAGEVEKGLDIVRAARKRYDGRVRNPFNEYECGHWYARAMSSYGLLQGLTGIKYDAVDQRMNIDSKVGDNFTSFFSTQSGWGNLRSEDNVIALKVEHGYLDLQELQFTHGQIFSEIVKIEVGTDEIQGEFSQEDNVSKVLFGKLLKLDAGDEFVISLR